MDVTNLTGLNLGGANEGPIGVRTIDLTDFSEATNLEGLGIDGFFVENPQVLANFSKMVGMSYRIYVKPGASPYAETVAAISNYKGLGNLTFEISEAPPLSTGENPEIVDLSPWSELEELTILKVENSGLFNLKDVEFAANLTNLVTLELTDAGLSDITPLIGLPWSIPVESRVDLSGNPDIPQEQIEALREKVGVIFDND